MEIELLVDEETELDIGNEGDSEDEPCTLDEDLGSFIETGEDDGEDGGDGIDEFGDEATDAAEDEGLLNITEVEGKRRTSGEGFNSEKKKNILY